MAPTGAHDRCPVCRTALAVEPSEPVTARRCPRCEADLWALALPSGPVFFVRRPGQSAAELIAALAGPGLGASAKDIASFLRGADRLDLVEFMDELEAAAGLRGRRRDA
jgi:hypothetical protein